ncbi:MAG TPA: hypothetical protein VNL94_05655, partial [Candidatus Binatia bacterium]|nr:hypothetical protein [Candidatus Binatia bacterium]
VQSGIATDTVAADNQTLVSETAGTTVTSDGLCVDNAGNADTSASVGPVKIDKTAPVITGVATPAANANGWNKTSVSVTFTCADTGAVQSTIDIDTVAGDNQNLTGQTTGTTVTSDGQCVDKAGNSDTFASVGPIKIDLTDPSVAIVSPATGLVTVAESIAVYGTASDDPSGIDNVKVNGGPDAIYSSGAWSSMVSLACGSNTITAVATDVAGRTTTSGSITVTRVCASSLTYYQPIDQSTTTPVVNTGKMGRVIPVKVTGTLTLGGSPVAMTEAFLNANGLTLHIDVNFASCNGTFSADAVETYADAGSSNGNTSQFRWSTSQWIYNLDTGRPPAVTMTVNQCYRLDVMLRDSSGVQILLSSGPGGGTYALFKPTK